MQCIRVSLLLEPEQVEACKRLALEEQTEDIEHNPQKQPTEKKSTYQNNKSTKTARSWQSQWSKIFLASDLSSVLLPTPEESETTDGQ